MQAYRALIFRGGGEDGGDSLTRLRPAVPRVTAMDDQGDVLEGIKAKTKEGVSIELCVGHLIYR